MTRYYSQSQPQVNYEYVPHQMYNANQHIRPATNEGYEKEMTPVMTEKHIVYSDRRMTCCDRLCCGCFRCCPRWCRWLSCILFILIGILAIIIGILVALFKVPTVDFTGIQGTPSVGMNQTMINLGLDLGFSVTNPNIESVTFSSLKAQAFYHGYDSTSIGGGELSDLYISSNSVTNIQFPFTITIDIASQQVQAMMLKLITDCGLGGNREEKIVLDYRVEATVNIIGLSLQMPYSDTVDFDCPVNSETQQKVLEALGSSLLELVGVNRTELNHNASIPIDLLGLASSLSTVITGFVRNQTT